MGKNRFFYPVIIVALVGFVFSCECAFAELNYEYFEGTWNLLPDFDALVSASSGTIDNFDISSQMMNDNFAFRFTGCIQIGASGNYTFYAESDDGSRLYINEQLIVDNDGLHPPVERSGVIYLDKGFHSITVTFFERGGGEVLSVSYEGPGIVRQIIPKEVLFTSVPVLAATK